MKSGTMRRRTYEMATLGLLLVCAVWVGRLASQNRELGATVATVGSLAERSSVRDRLIGTVVPLSSLGLEEATAADAHLVWVVDVARCVRCLDRNVGPWNALAVDSSLQRHVVLYGAERLQLGALRALRGTKLTSASREELDSTLGPLLPSTKLLIDAAGTVVMADSRTIASGCRWSFEAQLGVLRGIFTTDIIRYPAQ